MDPENGRFDNKDLYQPIAYSSGRIAFNIEPMFPQFQQLFLEIFSPKVANFAI